MINIKL